MINDDLSTDSDDGTHEPDGSRIPTVSDVSPLGIYDFKCFSWLLDMLKGDAICTAIRSLPDHPLICIPYS